MSKTKKQKKNAAAKIASDTCSLLTKWILSDLVGPKFIHYQL